MSLGYVVRRIGLLFLVIWAAATLNFFIPRLSPNRDPIRERLGQLAATGGLNAQGIEEMVKAYQTKFGLDKPIWEQYLNYVTDLAHLDFGYSLANYPARVTDLIGLALPWTLVLLIVSTLLSFTVGTLLGALTAWPGSPGFMKYMIVPFMTLSAVPYYLLGLILLYVLGVQTKIFPLFGGYSLGTTPGFNAPFVISMVQHAILPALSIVLSGIGFWGLSMWGMMITTLGQDYVTLAEANGLKGRDIFLRYGLRNAILPQSTALALSLGFIVSGSVLVEVVFAYPGIGTLLFQGIQGSDFFLIYGIVFIIILSIGVATTLIDLIYPLLDPRIKTGRRD
ncbi:MAG: ABC transporter permease [Anaerolineae bacterium]|nr:ABC transporter permease [Anaerolineae bacterium]